MRELTSRWRAGLPVGEFVEAMNRVLRGWGNTFWFGNPQQAMKRLNYFAEQRLQ